MKQPKRNGEIAQVGFVYKAMKMGFTVLEPFGVSERYDYVLNRQSRARVGRTLLSDAVAVSWRSAWGRPASAVRVEVKSKHEAISAQAEIKEPGDIKPSICC